MQRSNTNHQRKKFNEGSKLHALSGMAFCPKEIENRSY